MVNHLWKKHSRLLKQDPSNRELTFIRKKVALVKTRVSRKPGDSCFELKMSTAVKENKVSDMTVRELKSLIRDTLQELIDPDYGSELRPEVEESLKRSIKSKKRTPVEKVASELGLKW